VSETGIDDGGAPLPGDAQPTPDGALTFTQPVTVGGSSFAETIPELGAFLDGATPGWQRLGPAVAQAVGPAPPAPAQAAPQMPEEVALQILTASPAAPVESSTIAEVAGDTVREVSAEIVPSWYVTIPGDLRSAFDWLKAHDLTLEGIDFYPNMDGTIGISGRASAGTVVGVGSVVGGAGVDGNALPPTPTSPTTGALSPTSSPLTAGALPPISTPPTTVALTPTPTLPMTGALTPTPPVAGGDGVGGNAQVPGTGGVGGSQGSSDTPNGDGFQSPGPVEDPRDPSYGTGQANTPQRLVAAPFGRQDWLPELRKHLVLPTADVYADTGDPDLNNFFAVLYGNINSTVGMVNGALMVPLIPGIIGEKLGLNWEILQLLDMLGLLSPVVEESAVVREGVGGLEVALEAELAESELAAGDRALAEETAADEATFAWEVGTRDARRGVVKGGSVSNLQPSELAESGLGDRCAPAAGATLLRLDGVPGVTVEHLWSAAGEPDSMNLGALKDLVNNSVPGVHWSVGYFPGKTVDELRYIAKLQESSAWIAGTTYGRNEFHAVVVQSIDFDAQVVHILDPQPLAGHLDVGTSYTQKFASFFEDWDGEFIVTR
jgi:hypothetical protein